MALPAIGQRHAPPRLPSHRQSANDLEITIDGGSSSPGTIFLSREFLSHLHQVSGELQPDENFPELPSSVVHFTGVDLEALIKSTGVTSATVAAVAICRDGYASPFPHQAILDHHPILVLTMDGATPHDWASRHHTYDPSPYFVIYQDFIPSFRILAHQDWAQRPAEITTLHILPTAQLDSAITPSGISTLKPDAPINQGYAIARQNCVRCHNSGSTGGTKAHRTWQTLAKDAKQNPQVFAARIHNPESVDPSAKMPPNLKYDQATLNALTRYFQTFAP